MSRYCSENGCKTIISVGKYCDEHKRRVKKKVYYSANRSFYRSQLWIDLREAVRERDNYMCVHCGCLTLGKNSQVNHIIPIWLRPDLKLDIENCENTCAKCHPKVEIKAPLSEKEIKFFRGIGEGEARVRLREKN